MATAQEYFEKDSSQNLRIGATHTFSDPETGQKFDVTAALSLDFEAGVKYALLYIPETKLAGAILLNHYIENVSVLTSIGDDVDVKMGLAGTDEMIVGKQLKFSGRIIAYTPATFSPEAKALISKGAERRGLSFILRDGAYAKARAKHEVPLAFVSHDSRDKADLVRDLASKLQTMMCPVWYDEFSLKPGTSLRESIEAGIKECKKCVLVISPNFLSNRGWTRAEFDSVFTREILEKRNVIVPIWHNVTVRDVYAYSPRLADRVALNSEMGIDELARKICLAIAT